MINLRLVITIYHIVERAWPERAKMEYIACIQAW